MAGRVVQEVVDADLVTAPDGFVDETRDMTVRQEPIPQSQVRQDEARRRRQRLATICGAAVAKHLYRFDATQCQTDGGRESGRAAPNHDNLCGRVCGQRSSFGFSPKIGRNSTRLARFSIGSSDLPVSTQNVPGNPASSGPGICVTIPTLDHSLTNSC